MNVGKQAITHLGERIQKGKEKYNKEIDINDGHDWPVEALEELLDGVQYLTAFLMQRESAIEKLNVLKDNMERFDAEIDIEIYFAYRQALLDMGVKEEDLE